MWYQFVLVCWLSVVSSAAIDHSIHAREATGSATAGSTSPVDTSASNPPSTQDATAEGRGYMPYVMQSGQGSPPPPPVPQPGGVNPQAPYAAGIKLLLSIVAKFNNLAIRWSDCIWYWGVSIS